MKKSNNNDVPFELTYEQQNLLAEVEHQRKLENPEQYTKITEWSDTYYNGEYLLRSKRSFLFCLGNRSGGKSLFWLMYIMLKAVLERSYFIYLTRYKSDADILPPELFTDCIEILQQYDMQLLLKTFKIKPKNELDISFFSGKQVVRYTSTTAKHKEGIWLYDPYAYIEDKETAFDDTHVFLGYVQGLSTVEKRKPFSGMYAKVGTILFDEFLNQSGDYLGNNDYSYEPTLMFNFYQTVARGGGKTLRPEVKIIFISNTVHLYNPYFTFLSIVKQIINNTENMTCKVTGDGYALEIAWLDRSEVDKSDFGKLMARSAYYKNMVENEWTSKLPPEYIIAPENMIYDRNSPIAVIDGIEIFIGERRSMFSMVESGETETVDIDDVVGSRASIMYAKSSKRQNSTQATIQAITPYIKTYWANKRLRFENEASFLKLSEKVKL